MQVTGELDVATAPQLEASLRAPPVHARLVVLDLRAVGFIDGAGRQAILNASRRARRTGNRLVVLRDRLNVSQLITLADSSSDLDIRSHGLD